MSDQVDPGWVRSGWGHRVSTQDEAFRAITRIVSLAANRSCVWRGCTDSSRRVRSSLLRELVVDEVEPLPTERQLRQHEVALLRGARTWGLTAEVGPGAPDLHLLAHLHQHGVPTRLLDVTYDPMTALWFACDGDDDEPGVLLVFDTTGLPTYDTLDPQLSLRSALRRSALRDEPFLVRPTAPSARMRAQQGLYLTGAVPLEETTTGVDGLPVPAGSPPGRARLATLFGEANRRAGRPTGLPFCALVVPARLKAPIRNHLTAVNLRRSVLYPDAAGFAQAHRDGHVSLFPLPDVVSAHDDEDAGPG